MLIRLLAQNAWGGSVTKCLPPAVQPHDRNPKLGRAGAAAPPIFPIKRPAFDENENTCCPPTGEALFDP